MIKFARKEQTPLEMLKVRLQQMFLKKSFGSGSCRTTKKINRSKAGLPEHYQESSGMALLTSMNMPLRTGEMPRTVEDALSNPNKDEWLKEIYDELRP